MEEIDNQNQMEEQKRFAQLKWLHVVLVLSFIGSGLNFLSGLLMSLFGPAVEAAYKGMASSMPEEFNIMYETLFSTPRLMFVCLTVLYGMSLAGAWMMWRLRKNGFHLYTLSQLLILLVPVLFMGRSFVASGDIMLTLLFVAYYFIALRRIGAFQTGDEEGTNLPQEGESEEENEDENE